MTLEEQVRSLRRQQRGLLLLIIVGFVIAAVRTGADETNPESIPEVIRASRLEIVDESARVVAKIDHLFGCGYISTFGPDGDLMVGIGVTDQQEGYLSIKNSAGVELVQVGASVIGDGYIETRASDGRPLVGVSTNPLMQGTVITFDTDGDMLVQLTGHKEEGGGIQVFNAAGDPVSYLGVSRGHGVLMTYDRDGDMLIDISALPEGGLIAAFDSTGVTNKWWPEWSPEDSTD